MYLFKKPKLENKIVILITIFFCLYSPLLLIRDIGFINAGISFSAADSFYYFKVADNFAKFSTISFDGIHPTNGFHPLWQWILGLSFCNIHSSGGQIAFTFALSIILVTLAFVMISHFIFKITLNPIITLLSVFPGFSYFILSIIHRKYFIVWSYMNSMESVISLFMFGILLILILKYDFFVSSKKSKLIATSFVLTLITFSRLDDIFIFIPFFLNIFIQSENFKEFFKLSIIASLLPFVLIGSYLFYNYSYCGMWFPVSGAAKDGISLVNIPHLINVFFPVWLAFPARFNNWVSWLGTSLRAMQVFLLTAVTGIFLIKIWNGKKFEDFKKSIRVNKIIYLLSLFSVYILAKTIYNFVFVNIWNQAHWYFPISIVMINIIVAVFVSKYIKSTKLLFIGALLFIFLISNQYANLLGSGWDTKYLNLREQNGINITFFDNRARILDSLKHINFGKGVIEFDDGIISYSLKIPAISGFGFCIDKEAHDSLKNGKLLELASSCGIHALASVFYFSQDDSVYKSSETIRDYLKSSFLKYNELPENLNNWKFNLLFRDSISNFRLIGFTPK
jgi:hypothetical protein